MALVHPLFLGGLVAIAVPVLVHLVRRQTAERVLFPAAMLLAGSAEVVRRRRTFAEKLLLALRVALMAAAVFAFARPRLFLAGSDRSRFLGSVAIVADDTPSMGAALAAGSRRTRIDEARDAILAVLARLEEGSRVRLQAASKLLLEGSSDLDECRRAAGSLAAGEEAGSVAAALAESARWLASEPPPRELVVISDFQGSSWRGAGRTWLGSSASAHAVDLGGPLDDWAVLDLRPADDRAYRGAPFELRARVRSSRGGTRQAELVVSGRVARTRTLHLTAGVAEEFAFELVAPSSGPLAGELRLAGSDDWPANDSRAFAIDVCAPPRILCVGGGSAEGELASELLARALAPFAGGERALAQLERTEPPLRDASSLGRFDCIFLASPSALGEQDWSALAAFVEDGGGLVAFADSLMAESGFWARGAGRVLPAAGAELRAPAEPARLVDCDWAHPVLREFAGGANGNLEAVEFRRFLAFARTSGRALARFSRESAPAAILDSSRGRGRVLLVASSPARGWSTLFRESSFVPFVHEAAAYVARAERYVSALVGERPRIALHPAERGCSFTLEESATRAPATRALKADEESLVLPLGRLARRGLVRIVGRKGSYERERALAVELDPAESEAARIEPDAVLGLGARVSRSAEELGRNLDVLRGGTELAPVLAWVALGLFVAEMLVSWRLTRSRSRIPGLGPNLRGTI